MIESSEAYKAAITADARRTLLKAVIKIIDPDIVYGAVESPGEAVYSKSAQIHDLDVEDDAQYATLEHNRWLLNGAYRLIPDDPQELTGQVGFVGAQISGEAGEFSPAAFVELQFTNVDVLQAATIYFPGSAVDGIPVDFTVEIKSAGTAYYTRTITGNTARRIDLSGFTVYLPDAIRITVTRWSLPGRPLRIPEMIAGVYEEWTDDVIAEFNLTQQGDVSAVTLPFGTCTIRMDNLDRRFEPSNKSGLFASIEDKQGITISIGTVLADGNEEWKQVGVYYQSGGGWTTGNNDITMVWSLVDIVGLLVDREYIVPATLPTTLEGWIASVSAQLGENFAGHYTVDPDYAATPVTARNAAAVTGKTCKEIILWACQASGTWPRADAETGYLTAEPLWDQGGSLTLDNLNLYPTIKANRDLAAIFFTLSDGSQVIVGGNSTSAADTVSISNPFLHTREHATEAAKMILSAYGGNIMETVGRGNPSSEIGDVDTVELSESSAATGRRVYQSFAFADGVMQGCQSRLLQADGSFLFQAREIITQSGTWTAPQGVTALRIILVERGQDGARGQDGTYERNGAKGADGLGGRVFAATIPINPSQQFAVGFGDATTFGIYTSADGERFEYGFTDVASGDSFARPGVAAPLPGSGDGGRGGDGGRKGVMVWSDAHAQHEVVVYPTPGKNGAQGASGCVVVYYDKSEVVTV